MLEYYYHENGTRIMHYSNSDFMIRQVETGVLYESADDVVPCKYTYMETNILIPDDDTTAEEVLNIILGGSAND